MGACLGGAGFLLLLMLAAWQQRLPAAVAWLYCAASLVTAVTYAIDKRAAIDGRRRIAETTLQAMALLCGWPGGLAAQGLLRHKTAKAGFQRIFWILVAVNCGVLVWLMVRLR